MKLGENIGHITLPDDTILNFPTLESFAINIGGLCGAIFLEVVRNIAKGKKTSSIKLSTVSTFSHSLPTSFLYAVGIV